MIWLGVIIVVLFVLLYISYTRYMRVRDETLTGLWVATPEFAETIECTTMMVNVGKPINWRGDRKAYILIIAGGSSPTIVYDGVVTMHLDYSILGLIGRGPKMRIVDTSSNPITDSLPSNYDLEMDYELGIMKWYAPDAKGRRTLFYAGEKV